jgi:hypothetical protein
MDSSVVLLEKKDAVKKEKKPGGVMLICKNLKKTGVEKKEGGVFCVVSPGCPTKNVKITCVISQPVSEKNKETWAARRLCLAAVPSLG